MPSGEETVWFLTENGDKFREAGSILATQGVRIRHLRRPKVEIQDARLENVARFALEEALKSQKRPVVVEDSGLFIEPLGGFPGPFSSYVYETIGLSGILDLMRNHQQRGAYFQSSVAFGSPSVTPRVFTGKVQGRISRRIVGKSGFGYDPIFIPKGFMETFGQATPSFKNTYSHRARAFLMFAKWLKSSSIREKIRER